MTKRLGIFAIAVICIGALVLSAGCLGGTDESQPNLESTSWMLTGFTDGAAPASVISLTFVSGSASGSGGVNSYTSAYTIDPSKGDLTFSSPASTLMAGPQSYMNDETRYFTLLPTVTGYKVENGNLILTGSNGATLLTFEPALAGTSWELASYRPYNTNELTRTIGLVTLNFGKDGTYTANGGVNPLSGTWSLNGAQLTISDPTGGRIMGPPRLATQEDFYKLLLPSTTGYSFSMGQLMLTDAEGQVILTYKKPLADSSWYLTMINGAEPYSNARAVTLTFNSDGSVGGSAPVNSYGGEWSVTGATGISVDNVVSTMMAGLDQNANDYETQYFAVLNAVTSYDLGGTGLTLMTNDGRSLTFSPDHEQTLKSNSWTLAGNNAVTFNVADDGSVAGQAQVNSYRGTASLTTPNMISMGPFSKTLIAGSASQNTAETNYLAALENARTYDIIDGQLVFMNSAGTILLTFNPAA